MATVNVHEAKTHLSALLQRVEAGEEIVIARAGEPVAKLVPVAPRRVESRKPGWWKRRIVMSDDFDAPLPDEIRKAFEGEGE
jgi:prevent-host-death family protein